MWSKRGITDPMQRDRESKGLSDIGTDTMISKRNYCNYFTIVKYVWSNSICSCGSDM